ncbi:hypothetical protein [Prochlorococcus marinus]|uniref:hypothetical protein n=1 Tax=Prochlorococcus TaxID=1218 RepID=UPI0007B37E10|nr:hypothetical protein [Prochlorococcus marinus]KZR63595.1 hypothetical protein PMIT1312_01620 [Prochlorococcus marinus str. MIT 1312]
MAVKTLASEWPLSEWPATIKNVSKNGHPASCGCAVCSQAGNPSSKTNINLDEGELYFDGLRSGDSASGQPLTTDLIINEGSSISTEILEARYLYSNDGIIYLAFDYGVDDTRKDWWKDVIADADSIIEPEFAIVEPDNALSQVNIYQANSISDNTAGLYSYWIATDRDGNPVRAQTDDEGQPVEYKIEIAEDLAYTWASSFDNSDEAGWKHVAYHELGHALGLEHPFDFNDGDGVEKGVLDINDSVMSYTPVDDADGSPTFTSLDREAIEKIYGAETGQVASAPNGVELIQDLWPVNTPNNFGPPNYFFYLDSAYAIVDGRSWEEAEANAVNLGGNLVTLNTAAEQTWLASNYPGVTGVTGKWTGLTTDETGKYIWSGGGTTLVDGRALLWSSPESAIDFVADIGPPSTNGWTSDFINLDQPGKHVWFDNVGDLESRAKGDVVDHAFNPYESSGQLKPEGHLWQGGIAEIPLTYTLTNSSDQVDEGEFLTTSVSTNIVQADTSFFWSVSGENITADDFEIGSLEGEAEFNTNGNFYFEHLIANDLLTENNEDIEIKLFRDSGRTAQLGNTATATIFDTSFSPPTYTLTTSANQANEGQVLTTTVSTDYVGEDNASFFWGLSGKNITAADFAIGSLTGDSKFDANGNFSIQHSIANDGRTEGNENLEIRLFRDSGRSDQVGNTANVVIKDTSHSSDYIRRGDSAYVIVDGRSWEEAEANAVNLGGNLVTLNTAAEQTWLASNFPGVTGVTGKWTGLTTDETGKYIWSGGGTTLVDGHALLWSSPESAIDFVADIGPPSTNGWTTDFINLDQPGKHVWFDDAGGLESRAKGSETHSVDIVHNPYLPTTGVLRPDGANPSSGGIAEISLARSKPNLANEWMPNPQATQDSDLELSFSFHSTNGTEVENTADLKQLAVLGDSVSWENTYQLDITAESLNEGYNLETADITINFDPFLFNEIKASDITIGSQLPITNAVQINNDVGTIRIAAASLGDLATGQSISSEKVLASIELDFNEYRLDTLTQNANGKIIDPSTPLFFGLSANQDETVFSKALNDESGFANREIKSLRDLGGDLAVDGTKVTLYEATINLEEQGDGLILSSDLDIGSYNSKQTNLVRTGDTITATSEWTNVGNIKAKDIAITAVANDNASLTSSGFYISSPDDSQTSTNLESGSFVDGVFAQAGQETAQLVADIEITGAAGNVVDLSQGILSLQATGSDIFKNQKGSKNLITFQGDLNYDGRVSMKDLAYLNAGAARQQQASEHPDAVDANSDGFVDASVARGVDANFDGQISMADLAVLDADWGQSLHQQPINGANGTQSSFTGSDQISWDELDNQGTTGDAAWDNQAFKDQNAVEASNDFVQSLESPTAVGVIGADGNTTANDGDMQGTEFQDPLSS